MTPKIRKFKEREKKLEDLKTFNSGNLRISEDFNYKLNGNYN